MEKVFTSTTPMQVEVVDVEKVSQCSFYDFFQKIENFSKSIVPTKEYLQAPETRGLFCSFEACGQYVKKSGRIILEAYLAT